MGVYTDTYKDSDKAQLLTWILDILSKRQSRSVSDMFGILKRKGALYFYDKHYGVLHTLSLEDAADSIEEYCKNH